MAGAGVNGVGVGGGTVGASTVTGNVTGTASFPAASSAVHVTCVVPTAKRVPEAGVQLATPSPSTASCVEGALQVTTAPVWSFYPTVTCGAAPRVGAETAA